MGRDSLKCSIRDLIWFVIHLVWTISLLLYISQNFDYTPQNWVVIIGHFSLIQLGFQIISYILLRNKTSIRDFKMWFLVFMYLFMCGKQILAGVFNVTYLNGYDVLRGQYSDALQYQSSLYVLIGIQILYFGLFFRKFENSVETVDLGEEPADTIMYSTGLIMFIVSIICTLITDGINVVLSQTIASYEAVTSSVGLIDDIAMLVIPSFLYLLFSGKMKNNKSFLLSIVLIFYYGLIMILTGDRRYPIVSIIIIIISYFQAMNIKLKPKHLVFVLLGLVVLNILSVLRHIRYGGLLSVGDFFQQYGGQLFSFNETLYETLFEFGISFYTVCLALMYFPSILSFRYGATFLTSVVTVLPFGFLYNGEWYKFGRVADETMTLFRTSVGGSMLEDVYANFGWFSLIFLFVFGLLLANIMQRRKNSARINVAQYYSLFYALIHMCRTSFTETTRTAVWGIYILLGVYYTIKRKKC